MGQGASRRLTSVVAVAAATLIPLAPVLAQTAPMVQPSGVVVAILHLGGDSVQAAMLPLELGRIYRVEVTPATAVVQVRPPAPDQRPLPRIRRPQIDGGTAWAFLARHGSHYFELTNPAEGPAVVRVIAEGAVAAASVAAGPGGAPAPPVLHDSVVFDETFPGPRGLVELLPAYAYRVEITPAAASVSVRLNGTPGAPPLVLQPLSDPVLARGYGRLLLPTVGGAYRLDVQTNDVVRVRIVVDARETALYRRMVLATRNLPRAGIAARAVVIGPFTTPDQGRRGGVGMDLCLGAVPRGAWMGGAPIGGCALNVSFYDRGGGYNTVAFGIAPRLVASQPDAATQLSLGVSVSIGGTTSVKEQSYLMIGTAAIAERPIAGRLLLEGEGGLMLIHNLDDTSQQGPGQGTGSREILVPRVALGIQLRL